MSLDKVYGLMIDQLKSIWLRRGVLLYLVKYELKAENKNKAPGFLRSFFDPLLLGVTCTILVLAISVCACNDQQSSHTELDSRVTNYLVESDGIFEWFMDPAIRYVREHDRTYIGYYSSDGTVKIRYYDDDDKALSPAVTLWSDWGWGPGEEDQIGDDHACPSVIVLQHQKGDNALHNGKLLVAVAEHGSATEGRGRLEVRRSNNVEDISLWESAISVRNASSTYALLVEAPDGSLLLFTRVSEPNNNNWYFYTSADAGSTWGNSTLFFTSERNASNYVMLDTTANGEIHFILNRAIYGDPEPKFARYRDIFYIYRDSSAVWRAADGTVKILPFDFSDNDHTPDIVYESDATPGEEDWTWLWDIKVDKNGVPYLLSINQADMGSWDRKAPGKRICTGDVLRHNYVEGSWQTEIICKTGIFGDGYKYPAGAVLDEKDMDAVYASVLPSNGGYTEMQKWHKNGNTWAKVEDITTSSKGDNIRPMYVRNAGEHFKLVWACVDRYNGFAAGQWESMLFAYPGYGPE